MPTWKLLQIKQKRAEKLAIEAHASYLIIRSRFQHDSSFRNYAILEKAANRLYRRYHFAFGG